MFLSYTVTRSMLRECRTFSTTTLSGHWKKLSIGSSTWSATVERPTWGRRPWTCTGSNTTCWTSALSCSPWLTWFLSYSRVTYAAANRKNSKLKRINDLVKLSFVVILIVAKTLYLLYTIYNIIDIVYRFFFCVHDYIQSVSDKSIISLWELI